MKKLALIVLVAGLVAGGAAGAGAAAAEKDEGLMGWLKALQRRIETLTPQRSVQLSTGVAGIRGAKDDEQAKLYWKGKDEAAPVTADELEMFGAAVERALKGENAEAAKDLEAFLARYPDSPLTADAKKTLELMKKGSAQ